MKRTVEACTCPCMDDYSGIRYDFTILLLSLFSLAHLHTHLSWHPFHQAQCNQAGMCKCRSHQHLHRWHWARRQSINCTHQHLQIDRNVSSEQSSGNAPDKLLLLCSHNRAKVDMCNTTVSGLGAFELAFRSLHHIQKLLLCW
jgi:hypothetical protein